MTTATLTVKHKLIAVVLNSVSDGLSIKTAFGLLMAALMLWFGMRTKAQSGKTVAAGRS